MMNTPLPQLILRLAGYLLLVLTLVFFILLFIYESNKSEVVELIIDRIVFTIKLLVILAPLPVLITNKIKMLITTSHFVLISLFYLFLVWLFFIS